MKKIVLIIVALIVVILVAGGVSFAASHALRAGDSTTKAAQKDSGLQLEDDCCKDK
ncbi:MAG: hypothetical protein LBN08_03455 [Lactobacillales bacterium]|jgi:uncharacterized protein YxeA|nr:hypothetical protein [Lactobacillales bacterium]